MDERVEARSMAYVLIAADHSMIMTFSLAIQLSP